MCFTLSLFTLLFRGDEFDSSFALQCVGQVSSGNFDDLDYLYCRYCFTSGEDWEILGGLDNGLSQIACRNHLSQSPDVTWNFPVDISFKSTNVHGWPRIAISVYGLDYFGRDIIRGYGSALVPLQPGSHTVEVQMFRPVGNSLLNEWLSWLMGNPPEVILALLTLLSLILTAV